MPFGKAWSTRSHSRASLDRGTAGRIDPVYTGVAVYEFDWANTRRWGSELSVTGADFESKLPRHHVVETLLAHWEKDCIECARLAHAWGRYERA